jgi:4-amino-4-deoxy-L-arabinose transferase-like glycosyltransferase
VDSPHDQPRKDSDLPPRPSVPQGYRQGFITAITVMIGFSLAFIRFWSFEASGAWTKQAVIATAGLTVALVLQIVALVRSLRIEDDEVSEYRITVRWFVASVVTLGVALVGTAVVYAGKL